MESHKLVLGQLKRQSKYNNLAASRIIILIQIFRKHQAFQIKTFFLQGNYFYIRTCIWFIITIRAWPRIVEYHHACFIEKYISLSLRQRHPLTGKHSSDLRHSYKLSEGMYSVVDIATEEVEKKNTNSSSTSLEIDETPPTRWVSDGSFSGQRAGSARQTDVSQSVTYRPGKTTSLF